MGQYRTTPTDHGWGNPSRTTVDHDGSVWLTNRENIYDGYGSVVHIGLDENNQCHDRNNNKKIDTSMGSDDIGDWTTANVTTAEDECIVHYTKVNSQGARHVSVDKHNDVWVSGTTVDGPDTPRNFDLIKGGRFSIPESGTIIRPEKSVGFGGYGGFVHPDDGVIWSSGSGPLLRWNPVGNLTSEKQWIPTDYNLGPFPQGKYWAGHNYFSVSYGLCVDKESGHVWNTQLTGDVIHEYDRDGRYLGKHTHGYEYAQGCVVDDNGDVWVAHSAFKDTISSVGHLHRNGSSVGNVELAPNLPTFQDGYGPTGVAVDGQGKIWTSNFWSSSLSRIDPTRNGGIGEVDLTVELPVGCLPYTYGDMTGHQNSAPPNSGTWTVIHNFTKAIQSRMIEWHSFEPDGSSLEVDLRNDTSGWEPATNGQDISYLTGTSLYVRVHFTRDANGASPVLNDLSIVDTTPPSIVPTTPTTPPTTSTKCPTKAPVECSSKSGKKGHPKGCMKSHQKGHTKGMQSRKKGRTKGGMKSHKRIRQYKSDIFLRNGWNQ